MKQNQFGSINLIEREGERIIVRQLLSKYKTHIVALLITFGAYVNWNAVISYAKAHDHTVQGVLLLLFVAFARARAPKDFQGS